MHGAKLSEFKHATIFLTGISTASIPAIVRAEWSFIGLSTFGGSSSYTSNINDSGQIVGGFLDTSGKNHVFITGPDGAGVTDLGTLGGDYYTSSIISNTINDLGETGELANGAGNNSTYSFLFSYGGIAEWIAVGYRTSWAMHCTL